MSDAQNDELSQFIREMFSTSNHIALIEEFCTFDKTLSQYLGELLESHNLKKSRVIAGSGLNTTFGYQIFSGTRNPSRNKVISLSFAMSLTVDQSQRLLYCAGLNELYAKNRRDALLIWGLNRGVTLSQINSQLYSAQEALLSDF